LRIVVSLILALSMQMSAAQAGERSDVPAALEGFAEQMHLPGISLTIIERGEFVVDEALGFADLEQQVPMRTSTLNRIGSISKTMTAAAAIRMETAGKIDLDRKVSVYLGDFDGLAREVSLRQLASHTGCVRGYRDGEGISYVHYDDVFSALELFREDALECDPGAQFIYSSYGYSLLSAVLVRAEGEALPALMHKEIWAPLGLEQVAFDDLQKVIPDRVRNYDLDETGVLINAAFSDSSYKYAGAGILASTHDLARFGAALVGDGFMTDREKGKMFAPATLTDGSTTDYGLGLYVDFGKFIEARREHLPVSLYESLMAQASKHRIYWHSGTSEGAVAILMIAPDEGRVLALAMNRGGVEKEAIVFAMSLMSMLGADGGATQNVGGSRSD
jgi:serine beta-lactamase-like protein LACTB, mitochondrial